MLKEYPKTEVQGIVLFGSITTLLSSFLDHVTTVVLIAPLTILICEILGIDPLPYLMAEALLSDTGAEIATSPTLKKQTRARGD